MAQDVIGDLFDKGYQLQEEKADWRERNNAVRHSLWNLATAGVLNDRQYADLEELYPRRQKTTEEE